MHQSPRHAVAALLTIFLLATAMVGLVNPTAQATEDPAEVPTIVSPTEGQVIQGDFAGPITIDFSTVTRTSRWEISAVKQGGCSQPVGTSRCSVSTQVDVTADTGVLDVTLPEALGRSGTYDLRVVESTGGLAAQRTFTITGATDDTTPDPEPQPSIPGGHFVSPEPGGKVEEGFTGPVTINFNQTDQPYRYILYIDHERTGYATVYPTSSGGEQQVSIPALQSAGEYSLELRSYETADYYDDTYMTVLAPRPTVKIGSVSPTPFYPTVRDGFRDSVKVPFHIDQPTNVWVQVRNGDGHRVFTKGIGHRAAGGQSYAWNGRDSDGRVLPVGKYRVTVGATNSDGRTGKSTTIVTAISDTVTRHATDSWTGTQTDRRSKRGNCQIYGYSGALTLDCWMGTYARAEYDFHVPASTTGFSYTVRGERNCCNEGKITFTGNRVSEKRYTVAVQVTNWRSYTIRRVELDYAYRVRR